MVQEGGVGVLVVQLATFMPASSSEESLWPCQPTPPSRVATSAGNSSSIPALASVAILVRFTLVVENSAYGGRAVMKSVEQGRGKWAQ